MLQIKQIKKQYVTGGLTQTALDNVSLNFRDNEFVAVLGPSGSGKTTLLNIIGGLDKYDSGDLIINGISTKKYKDRDWDSYRNHTIGFVFQSYNLIPHQSVLANVELALTISGISKSERKKRAKEALEQVGLGNQLHKKPNQMSGGQMQRVAIARALVNNPDILLADEPTGALDSDTSVQVMEMLKDVAKSRLVIMVTHNPELAEKYATRIVKVRDGKITDDSNPPEIVSDESEKYEYKNMGKSSMSPATALSLSFNNLRTKKGRTLLTSFAGSIGIIGIAMILALSNGVNTYITDLQKSTMTSYPISISEQTFDMSSIIESGQTKSGDDTLNHSLDAVYSNSSRLEMAANVSTSIAENNLTEFKKYLDNPDSEINKYIGSNGIVYSYDVKFDVYTHDSDGLLVNTDGSTLTAEQQPGNIMDMTTMTFSASQSNFAQLMPGSDGSAVSAAITENYQVLYGSMPTNYDEIVLVLDKNNEISSTTMYQLGILPTAEYRELMNQIQNGEDISIDEYKWDYADICSKEFYLIPACDYYTQNDGGTFDKAVGTAEIEDMLDNALKLKITGVIKPNEDCETELISSPFGYTYALTNYLIEYTDKSDVVKAQTESKDVDIISGMIFEPENDADKIADAKKYLENMGVTDKADMFRSIVNSMASEIPAAEEILALDETALAGQLDEFLKDPDDDILLNIYSQYISTGTYEDNMSEFGVVSLDAPSTIDIYVDSFEDKDAISECINEYNKTVDEEDQITYTDYVALLMSSVTTIINVISYVLIAFVAVSLIVSSIMIGIITYISVLERTKEIGILRAIGASKRNISQVFNAETFIIGLCSGLMGIIITLLLLIPANSIIHAVVDSSDVNAVLPFTGAVILILLSIVLTLIGGIIPSSKAAKKDAVAALRTE